MFRKSPARCFNHNSRFFCFGFLPALGYYNSGQLYNVGSNGNYWSRSPYGSNTSNAYNLNFNSSNVNVNNNNRNNGFVVAPGWFRQPRKLINF